MKTGNERWGRPTYVVSWRTLDGRPHDVASGDRAMATALARDLLAQEDTVKVKLEARTELKLEAYMKEWCVGSGDCCPIDGCCERCCATPTTHYKLEDNVKAIFHGGYSYAVGEPETFASVDAVATELENRYFNRSGRFPVVDSSATFVVFLGDKLDYPDYVVSIDDNGDTKVERV